MNALPATHTHGAPPCVEVRPPIAAPAAAAAAAATAAPTAAATVALDGLVTETRGLSRRHEGFLADVLVALVSILQGNG